VTTPGVKDNGWGFECHDCGETFKPGESTARCAEQGHYVAPITACELPFLFPAKKP
jgi:hypothetical protein